MNREIKFRAWDGKNMINNVGVHPHISMVHEDYEYPNDGCMTLSQKMESYAIMQYTGLKDKNGKEIYEGDIVENNDMKWEIVFKHAAFCIEHADKDKSEWELMTEDEHSEVIGNIHENNELL